MEGQKYWINHCSIFYIRDWVLFWITLTVKLRKFCIKRADKSPIPIERRLKVLVSRVNPPTRYHSFFRRQNFPLYCKRSSAERNPRWKKTFFQLMNGTLIWSLSICKTKIALKGMAMKQTITNKWNWKLLCCQTNSLKRYWNLLSWRKKRCTLTLMIMYAL